MSRILVDVKDKAKSKKSKARDLSKNQDIDEVEDSPYLSRGSNNESDQEFEYSESSEESDDEHFINEAGASVKKKKEPLKQYKLIEIQFPETMLKAQGKVKLAWDIIIIVLSVWQGFSIPLQLSFDPDFFYAPELRTADSLIDVVFMLDIILRFRTTYIDSVTGEEIMDSFSIGKKYITSPSFIIDTLSTVPLDDFIRSESRALSFLGMLKLLRIFKISTVILNLNTGQEIKAACKVAFLILMMVFYIHWMACLWNSVVMKEEVWIPNMDFIWYPEPQIYDYYSSAWGRTYAISLYIGYYLFGVGEVCPRAQLEILVAIPILIFSSIINGLIIGNMALFIHELNKKNADF